MYPLVSIMILNWNRADETQRAIASALNQSYRNCEVILVDNGSTDNSVELTKRNFPDLKVIELDKNYGCPGGRNQGVEYCIGEYIFYLDNDGILHVNAVENAVNTILKYKNIGVVTGVLYDFVNENQIDTEIEIVNRNKYFHKEFQGGISLHKKEIYKLTGLYPEHFMYGAEELYISLKLLDSNYKIIKDESVVLWHKKSFVARDMKKEKMHSFYNKLYVAIALYPTIYAIQFFFYFPVRYFFYSKKEGILLEFLKSLLSKYFTTTFKALKCRTPVSIISYRKFSDHKRQYLDEVGSKGHDKI